VGETALAADGIVDRRIRTVEAEAEEIDFLRRDVVQ
jgi:hypothetical protein